MESSLRKDPSLSPSKQVKSKRKTHHYQHQVGATARLPNISRQSSCNSSNSFVHQKFAPSPHVQSLEMVQLAALAAGGVFFNHHPNNTQFSHSFSLPPILPTYYYQHPYHQQPRQPPLLPLPVASKSLPPPATLSRSHSLASPIPRKPPTKTKATKNTAATTTTIKKKPAHQNIKKENKQFTVDESSKETEEKKASEDVDVVVDDDDDQIVWPAKGAGPDPGTLPKEFMTRVLLPADLNNKEVPKSETDENNKKLTVVVPSNLNNLSSPPPSSLPLPKFTMRKNTLSCNAQAAAVEVDSGATDNLRRLLKLR